MFFHFQSRPSVLFSRSPTTTATGRFVKIHTTSQRTATSRAITTSCPQETAARRPTRTRTANNARRRQWSEASVLHCLCCQSSLLKLFWLSHFNSSRQNYFSSSCPVENKRASVSENIPDIQLDINDSFHSLITTYHRRQSSMFLIEDVRFFPMTVFCFFNFHFFFFCPKVFQVYQRLTCPDKALRKRVVFILTAAHQKI